jgi:hypothetical protein
MGYLEEARQNHVKNKVEEFKIFNVCILFSKIKKNELKKLETSQIFVPHKISI